jgi:hypothetical protein
MLKKSLFRQLQRQYDPETPEQAFGNPESDEVIPSTN